MFVLTSPNGATLCTLPGLPSSGIIPLASTHVDTDLGKRAAVEHLLLERGDRVQALSCRFLSGRVSGEIRRNCG
jgi:hypothetical protein